MLDRRKVWVTLISVALSKLNLDKRNYKLVTDLDDLVGVHFLRRTSEADCKSIFSDILTKFNKKKGTGT